MLCLSGLKPFFLGGWLVACSEAGPSASLGAAGHGAVAVGGDTGQSGVGTNGGQQAMAGTGGDQPSTGTGGGGGSAGSGGQGGSAGSGGQGEPPAGVAAKWTHSPFIMDTWFWEDDDTSANDVARVKANGFQGFATSFDHDVPGYVQALVAAELPMVGVYTVSAIDGYPTGIVDAIASTDGWIWLAIDTAPHPNSDPAGDSAALQLIGALADECQAKGLPGVALYPHVGFWMERTSDAVRLAGQAARANVGVVFNQYHWMVVDAAQGLEVTLAAAAPYLRFVTINGSEVAPSIIPLGQGAYDVRPILQAVAALDFAGSVGLQGYSISGDVAGKLASSKQAWDALVASVAP